MTEPLFSLPEVSDLTKVRPVTICTYIKKELIRPAVLGRRGSGHGHRFTLSQTIALAVVQPCAGLPASRIAAAVQAVEDKSQEFLIGWITGEWPEDGHDEEAAAVESTEGPQLGTSPKSVKMTPELGAVHERLLRIVEVWKAKKAAGVAASAPRFELEPEDIIASLQKATARLGNAQL